MAYYNKKIIYLSCMEYGNKVKNAGFIKIENEEKKSAIDVRISGMSGMPNKTCEIMIETTEGKSELIGKIFLHQGKGEWKESFLRGKIGKMEISYEEISGFRIEISDNRYIEGRINNTVPIQAVLKEEPELKAENIELCMEDVISSDKWQQLMQTYPVIHPYEDEREYISIQPKDFVIMTGNFQHLANNSFLLHGFYNYRHLILGKEYRIKAEESGKKEEVFYLGVPGVFYEREKMVALMFGFEVFECAGGKVEIGKSGYYLRTVTI